MLVFRRPASLRSRYPGGARTREDHIDARPEQRILVAS